MRELRETKEKLLTEELGKLSVEICRGNFQIRLRQVPGPGNKLNYVVDDIPSTYFAIKQLEHNIRTVYNVKQSNRFEIIFQLQGVLADRFPKYVIRTDVIDFYESIPQESLLKRIDEDALLILPSRKLIRQILNSYRNLSGSQVGLPRGVGISAYLAELYMRPFDAAIKAHQEVVYYARYVDDMMIIFAPRPNMSAERFWRFVKERAAAFGLTLNVAEKTMKRNLERPRRVELEYLGYKLTFGEGSLKITLGDKRRGAYKDRIKRSFDAYLRRQRFDEKRARRLLVRRVQFNTGNTRLSNNKKNVMVGVYYSNSLLSSLEDLKFLDGCLRSQIGSLKSTRLKNRLKKLSFEEGFLRKTFREFGTRELKQIVKPWKYEK
jgi:hypothetical protein